MIDGGGGEEKEEENRAVDKPIYSEYSCEIPICGALQSLRPCTRPVPVSGSRWAEERCSCRIFGRPGLRTADVCEFKDCDTRRNEPISIWKFTVWTDAKEMP